MVLIMQSLIVFFIERLKHENNYCYYCDSGVNVSDFYRSQFFYPICSGKREAGFHICHCTILPDDVFYGKKPKPKPAIKWAQFRPWDINR